METPGDALIIVETIRPGHGAAAWYRSRWEQPAPRRAHPWRPRIAAALRGLARALTPTAVEPGHPEPTFADGAARAEGSLP